MPLPLEGTRVIDMAWFGPGPVCSTLLGDMGADIIKVHEPHPERRGSLTQFAFPDMPGFPGIRNCRIMGLDLKSEAGREIFPTLAKSADVVIESFRPGVMKRLGTDYDSLKSINPGIVYASLSGYGQDGPYRDLPGHDINYISIAGLLAMTGIAGGPPVIPGLLVGDFAAGGMAAVIGILAALRIRDRTGQGQQVDVSITDGLVELMSMWINPYLTYGMRFNRGDTMFTGHYPWYAVYKTRDDKYVSVGAFEPWFYANLCKALGREDYAAHQYSEGQIRDEIFEHFRKTFLTRTRDEWVQDPLTKEACVAPVYSIDEVAEDPQLISRGMVREMPHPSLGTIRQVGSMVKISGAPFEARNWSVRFGQHTEEILSSLGYDSERIKALREAGTID